MKKQYYSLKKIMAENADYNIIIGERSNGKTYSTLAYILADYVKNNNSGAYIRRWKDDIQGKRADTVFNSLIDNDVVRKLTDNEYETIIYTRGCWHSGRTPESLWTGRREYR